MPHGPTTRHHDAHEQQPARAQLQRQQARPVRRRAALKPQAQASTLRNHRTAQPEPPATRDLSLSLSVIIPLLSKLILQYDSIVLVHV